MSLYLYTLPFHHLMLAGLTGFLAHRLRLLPASPMMWILISLLSLSSLGSLLESLNGFLTFGSYDPTPSPSGPMSLRQGIRFVGLLLSPFATGLILIALTVLVCRPMRSPTNQVVTPEERYGKR